MSSPVLEAEKQRSWTTAEESLNYLHDLLRDAVYKMTVASEEREGDSRWTHTLVSMVIRNYRTQICRKPWDGCDMVEMWL